MDQRKPAALIALLVLLAAALAIAGWLMSDTRQAPAKAPVERPATNSATRAQTNAAPLPAIVETPPDDTEPEVVRAALRLPDLTRFRALVLEADAATAAAVPPAARSEEAWESYSTLDQLKSRFAPHARLVYEGKDTPADRAEFSREIRVAFERPDIASSSFSRVQGERVELWLRDGVVLPAPEAAAPANVAAPITRRLQEHVDLALVSAWLAAMEAEFGATPFGRQALPLDFVILGDGGEYLSFAQKRLRLNVPRWSAGLYSSSWQVICLPVLHNTCMAEVIRHEMFHALQAALAPESLLVPWFAEGTAEWIDKVPPAGGKLHTHADFAAAAWGYLASLVEGGYELNLRQFLALELQDFYANPELNYLLAYCWIDFVRTEPDLTPPYYQYWELLKDGVGRDHAFARTFGGLDFDALTARFLARARSVPRNTEPPRFSHDAHENSLEHLPATLGGTPTPPIEGKISSGWFEVLAELKRRGFDTARVAPLPAGHDLLVVAIDSSETMAHKIEDEWFDWDGFSRWLFALRYSGRLSFNRKGGSDEQVPSAVLMATVEAVLSARVKDFTEATGIDVASGLQADIRDDYAKFEWTPDKLKEAPKRELCLRTAESIAWFWGTQSARKMIVVDFNTKVQAESERGYWKSRDINVDTPLARLFLRTGGNGATFGADGIDCDWWLGLTGCTQQATAANSTKAACLFFTDGPNSAGAYGHPVSGRSVENYSKQQVSMAEDFALEWQKAGLNNTGAVLQLIALPGAQNEGLDNIPHKVAEARLDVWSERFRK